MTSRIREAADSEEIIDAEFVYRNIGPAMQHNYLCAVCRQNKAVIETWWGVLQPCWECRDAGYTRINKLSKGSIAHWIYRKLIDER